MRTHRDVEPTNPGSRVDLRTAEATYQNITLFEFPWETVTALNLAFYRTFAAPRMARLISGTGEMERNPGKRSQDTGLFMYDIIASGLDSERGREAIRRVNAMHHRWPIEAEDLVYVLCAFLVVPVRWIDAYGHRRLTETEREAATVWHDRLGHLMGIKGFPRTYAGAAVFLDRYEERNLHYSPEAARLMQATRAVFAHRLPRGTKFLIGPMLRALLGDVLCRCFGMRPADPLLRTCFTAGLRIRGRLMRRRPPRTEPFFRPGQPSRLYPDGYTLAELGVRHRDSDTA